MQFSKEKESSKLKKFIEDFKNFFVGRKDAYILQQNNGIYTAIKEEITELLLLQHVKKQKTVGSYCAYQIDDEWYCKWVCIDIDNHDNSTPMKELELFSYKVYIDLIDEFHININDPCREFSGGGYHIWIKLMEKSTLERAFDFKLAIANYLLKTFNLDAEIFPKQATIDNGGYGNAAKLPLSINRKYNTFCEILDDFDLAKQGSGYKIPDWIPTHDLIEKNPRIRKASEDNEPEEVEIVDECFEWFLNQIKPCLKAIALGKLSTHNCPKDTGHLMNISLCNALHYVGAPIEIRVKAFEKQPFFSYAETKKKVLKLEKGFKKKYAENLSCKTIRKRGFCLLDRGGECE